MGAIERSYPHPSIGTDGITHITGLHVDSQDCIFRPATDAAITKIPAILGFENARAEKIITRKENAIPPAFIIDNLLFFSYST